MSASTMRRGRARGTYSYRGYFLIRQIATNVRINGGSDRYWSIRRGRELTTERTLRACRAWIDQREGSTDG